MVWVFILMGVTIWDSVDIRCIIKIWVKLDIVKLSKKQSKRLHTSLTEI